MAVDKRVGRETTIRPLLLALIAICPSGAAFAQTSPTKRPLRSKSKEPLGYKFVGTVRGAKLWSGDCVALETASEPAEEQSLPDRAAGAIPPDTKQ